MKKLIAFALFGISLSGYAQTFTRHLEPFEELKVSRGINATLVRSNSDELTFEVHGLSKDDIFVEQDRNTLSIKVRTKALWEAMEEENWWVKVKIPYQKISSIDALMGSQIHALNIIESDDLYIDAGMGSEIDLELNTGHLTLDCNMGSITELEGKTSNLNVDTNMGAVIKALNLEAKYVRVKASMGSEVKVYCLEEFDGSASMGAQIEVKGKPKKWFENESMGGDIDGY